jgi:hypothetical protein
VTYDSSTGKLYEELGATSSSQRLSSSYFQVEKGWTVMFQVEKGWTVMFQVEKGGTVMFQVESAGRSCSK